MVFASFLAPLALVLVLALSLGFCATVRPAVLCVLFGLVFVGAASSGIYLIRGSPNRGMSSLAKVWDRGRHYCLTVCIRDSCARISQQPAFDFCSTNSCVLSTIVECISVLRERALVQEVHLQSIACIGMLRGGYASTVFRVAFRRNTSIVWRESGFRSAPLPLSQKYYCDEEVRYWRR